MSDKVVGTITLEHKITAEDVSNIICTMLEGGSNYWIEEWWVTAWKDIKADHPEMEYKYDVVAKGYALTIKCEDFEGKGTTEYHLRLSNFMSGLKMFAEKHNKSAEDLDPGNIDANDADCILQYALFRELVFG